jgi:hypothetical protein
MGPEIYRQCVQGQLDELARTPMRPSTSGLASDDRDSIEWICGYSKRLRGPAAYYRCIQSQLVSLAHTPARPDTSKLLADEQDSIESACGYLRRFNGPGPYNRCVQNQVDDLARTPVRPDISRLPVRERITIEAVCGYQRRFHGPSSYYRCLQDGLRSLATAGAGAAPDGVETASIASGPGLPMPGAHRTRQAAARGAGLLDTRPLALAMEETTEPDSPDPLQQFAHRAVVEWRARKALWLWLMGPILLLLILCARMLGRRARLCVRCGRRAESHGLFCRGCLAAINEAARAHTARRAARKEYENCFAVLGIPSGASREQIRAAYRKEMRKYHPDMVAQLGGEIQEMAKRKAQAINRAYHQLVR